MHLPNPNTWGRLKDISGFEVRKKFSREFFFRTPLPLWGYPTKKKLYAGTRNFFSTPPLGVRNVYTHTHTPSVDMVFVYVYTRVYAYTSRMRA